MTVVAFALFALLAVQVPLLEDAWKLAAKGQRAQAIELARKVIAANPTNADARLLLGSLLMEQGDRDGSIRELTEAVKLRPKSAEAQNALGEAYHSFGDSKSARSPFEKAVALNPRFALGQLNLGLVQMEAGEFESSAVHLDRAIALLPKNADAAYAHYLRGKVYGSQSDPVKAVTQLEQAVALQPDMAEAWSELGQARKQRSDEKGALAAFERSVQQNPENPIAQYRLGAEYLQLDQIDPAAEHLQTAYKLKPDDQSTLNSLQIALRQQGKTEEANKIKQELAAFIRRKDQASQNAVKAVTLNNAGVALEKAGDMKAASEKYRAALELNPEHLGFRLNYAVSLLRLGRWTDGLNQLHDALQRDPSNAKIQAALKDALSQAPRDSIPKWSN